MNRNNNAYFIISKEEMLSELLRSKENGVMLGVFSAVLGSGMFFCHVKDVWRDEDEDDVIILLNENALVSGHPDVHVLYLREIERIYTFSIQGCLPLIGSSLI